MTWNIESSGHGLNVEHIALDARAGTDISARDHRSMERIYAERDDKLLYLVYLTFLPQALFK